MQFYIINKDPWINAKILPDYCIKQVNVREGWQILSDCGHAIGVTWLTQNKEYNRYHPNTWRYWKNEKAFYDFIDYYIACLIECKDRFGECKLYLTYRDKLRVFMTEALPYIKNIESLTDEQHVALYLLNRKKQHLNIQDLERMMKGDIETNG